MTSISVIVPTYTRAGLLKQALETILAQTRPVEEIIVVDDGSSDNTREVVQALKGPVHYVHQENAGKPRALNNAMARAKGEAIWICDDDDLLLPTACETLAGTLEASGADVAFGTFDRFSDDPETGARRLIGRGYWPDLSSGAMVRHVLEDFFIFHNAMLVRREAYDRAGSFNEKMLRSEDYDMLVRLAVAGPFAFVDAPVFHYRMHAAARGTALQRFSASDHSAKAIEFDRTVFRQHMASLDAVTLASLFEADNPGLAMRAAHLQRACIFARRVMWDEAIAELTAATSVQGIAPGLHPVEVQICSRMFNGKYGIDALIASEATLAALSRIDGTGSSENSPATARAILAAMIQGGRWRIREALGSGNIGRARSLTRAFGRLAGRRLPGILLTALPQAISGRQIKELVGIEEAEDGGNGRLRERRDVVLLPSGFGCGTSGDARGASSPSVVAAGTAEGARL